MRDGGMREHHHERRFGDWCEQRQRLAQAA